MVSVLPAVRSYQVIGRPMQHCFYRATLCISAVVAVTRVHLSVTMVDCIHTAEDIVKLLVQLGSPITLVFLPHVPIPNSKGNLFSADAKYMGGGENLRFSTEIVVYLRNGTR